jgi:putative peptidoglycan lipid II flippase
VSFAVAALPVLSQLSAKKKMDDFVATISTTFRQILFFVVPISVLLYVLRAQVVRVILGSGQFSWLDTRLTAAALAIFVLSLFAQGALPLLVRGFYALHNTKTPFLIGIFALVANVAGLFLFAWAFSFQNWFSFFVVAELRMADLWGVADLRVLAMPLAISFSSVVNLFFLMLALRHKIGRLDGRKILDSSARIIFASLGGGLFAYYFLQLVDKFVLTETFLGILFQGFVAGSVGLLGYLLLGYLLNMEEMSIFVSSMHKKLFRKVRIAEDISSEGEGV